MKNIAINGFGRIGKMVAKIILEKEDFNLVRINDLADINTQTHLFKYDSVHGKFSANISHEEDSIIVNGHSIKYSSEEIPSQLNWHEDDIDIVLECTGRLTDRKEAQKHIEAGAKKVIISAPSPSEDVKTVLVGINDSILSSEDIIVSNASCTTNSAGPLIKILDDACGIESAYITTVHSYTGDQKLHDSPHHDLRRARAAAESIVPTTSGAAKAITKIFSHLEGKVGGCGIRVPVPNGSLTDISCVVKNPLSIEAINELFKEASSNKLSSILEYTNEPIVSKDIIGNPHSCIFDSQLTSVIGNMIKVVGWYDNESGYGNRLHDLTAILSNN